MSILILLLLFSMPLNSVFAQDPNFATALDITTNTIGLTASWWEIDVWWQLESRFTWQWVWWAEWVRDFIARLWLEVLLPIFVFVWVILAIIWFYKLMIATTNEETEKASQFILRWILWIMIMLSAWYLVDQLVWVEQSWQGWVVWMITWWEWWWAIAGYIYDNLFFPFLRIFIYLVLWILFIFALINALKYIFNDDESTRSKWIQSLIFATLWIVIIILARSVVEMIYGSYESVTDWESNLGEIWEWFFNNPDYTVIQNVINRFLGLATFIMVIMIIYQWYMLLINQTDENGTEKLRKTLLYMFVWIVIIWLSYLIVNMFVIQA